MPPVNLPGPIDWLVSRRFPNVGSRTLPPSLGRPRPGPAKVFSLQDVEAEAYRDELKALPAAELQVLYESEYAKAVEEQRAKAEQDERERFFNQPWANADFAHWSKAAHWTLDEAIALSFGKAPEYVNWSKVQPYAQVSPFAIQYARRRDLALRAIPWQKLFDPVLPSIFLNWAKQLDIPLPEALVAAVDAIGPSMADWKKLYGELREQSNRRHNDWVTLVDQQKEIITSLEKRIAELETAAQSASLELSPRERDSLLKIVIGMAVGGYRYNPKASRSMEVSDITKDLESAGVALDIDTVRKWLRAGAEFLPVDEEK